MCTDSFKKERQVIIRLAVVCVVNVICLKLSSQFATEKEISPGHNVATITSWGKKRGGDIYPIFL